MKTREITTKNGRLVCPIGNGRFGVHQPVLLVTELDAQGKIVRSFFRIRFDGHCVEADSRHGLKQKVQEAFEQNTKRQWFRFLIPTLHTNGTKPLCPFMPVVADACMVEAFEPAIQGKTRGTRIRHADRERPGRFLQESQPAVGGLFSEFIPDTPENRRALRDIQRELTVAVRRAERRKDRLIKRFFGKAAPEFLGEKTR